MGFEEATCPRCGAPIAAQPKAGLSYCAFCCTPLIWAQDRFQVSPTYNDDDLIDPHQPRLWLGGHRYRVAGLIAEGESSDVMLALRDHRLTERVVMKSLRVAEDRDLMDAEWETLNSLQTSRARGSDHFTRLLPHPVARGEARLGLRGRGGISEMLAYGLPSGFVHTFMDARDHYPQGIPATAAVWLYKRILEILSFVHASGYIHGALVPRHLLVHARDHGVRFCGFGSAVRSGQKLHAFPAKDTAFNSAAGASGQAVGPAHDICTSARSILWLLGGGHQKAPPDCPAPLKDLLERAAAPDASGLDDAWSVREQLDEAAHEAFGPPRFIPFPMPGWALS